MVNKKSIEALENALRNGLDNSQLDFFIEDKELTFADYISARESVGCHQPTDNVPAGMFIFGEDNFVGKPDTVFHTSECGAVAFYKLFD